MSPHNNEVVSAQGDSRHAGTDISRINDGKRDFKPNEIGTRGSCINNMNNAEKTVNITEFGGSEIHIEQHPRDDSKNTGKQPQHIDSMPRS